MSKATRRTPPDALIAAAAFRSLRQLDAATLHEVGRLLDARVPKAKIVDWLREDPSCAWVEYRHVDSFHDYRRSRMKKG